MKAFVPYPATMAGINQALEKRTVHAPKEYNEGRKAYQDNLNKSDNPYTVIEQRKEQMAWLQGFIDERQFVTGVVNNT